MPSTFSDSNFKYDCLVERYLPECVSDSCVTICKQHQAVLQDAGGGGIVGPHTHMSKYPLQAPHKVCNERCTTKFTLSTVQLFNK